MSKPTAQIFDRNRLIGNTAAISRTTASWPQCGQNGFVILGDVAWGDGDTEGSTLIVYSIDVLSDEPETVQWARDLTAQHVRSVNEPTMGETE